MRTLSLNACIPSAKFVCISTFRPIRMYLI
jgi:hypothetical protein